KRGNNILKIEASNLPMGMIEDVEVDGGCEQLKTGYLLIMMSDGIFEGAQHGENHELLIKRKIK
ncbi:SpoIIE family protein phosphatase, partial [Bacillus cereus group sp. N34]|nr:SpoIIE family protein phosphatase [Bacillus cereus group sp. N34]